MIKNRLLQSVAVMTLALSMSAFPLVAHANGSTEEQKTSPFLIVGKMPHLAKLLIQHWDSPELNLTPEQKEKLLVVRKETMGAVKQLSPKITKLEKQIVDGIQTDKNPDELQPLVQEIANLKATATQIHLRCIYNSKKILTNQQFRWLEHL